MQELMRAGVKSEVAKKATTEVYAEQDPIAIAMALAERQAPRFKRLDPEVAKRRLVGMLMRRGFDFESIKSVVAKVLGRSVGWNPALPPHRTADPREASFSATARPAASHRP